MRCVGNAAIDGPPNLPAHDAARLLAVIKADPNLRAIPVVVVSGSNAESDIARAYDEQVAAYIAAETAGGSIYSPVLA